MDKLDENYLDLVRESLYKNQRVVSTKHSIVRSKNANKLKLEPAGNEESPKNSVQKRFKTKKETFKAKAKLQNKSRKKAQPKQVTFIDNTSKILPPESSDSKESSDKVQNRVATPYKNVKLEPKLKSQKLQESQDEIVSVTKKLSPSLNENDGTTFYPSKNENLVLKQVIKKDTNVKGKKRLLSESDRPEGNIKRKKEKPFEKTGKKLMFEDCSDEDSQKGKVFNGSPGIGQTNKIVTRKKYKNRCTDKNVNINFTVDNNWHNTTESNLTHNTWDTLNNSHDNKNKEKTEKFVKKSKNKIGKMDDKTSNNNQENGGYIPEFDHSNKVSNLILKNHSDVLVTSNSTIARKSTYKNKKQTKKDNNLKLRTIRSKKIDKNVLDSNSDSSNNSTSSFDMEFKAKQLKKSSNTLEDPAEISDSCDNDTVGVKGLKFQRFCNLFAPTPNEQFLGQDIALRIPQKYFVVSKNDFESDGQCEERPSPKCKKNKSSRKLKNTNISLEHSQTNKEVPTEITELISSDSKKKEQKKKINILDVQVLGKKVQESISSTNDEASAEKTFDSQENFNSSTLIQIRNETYYSHREIPNDIINNRSVVVTLKNKNKIVALNLGAKMHFHGLCRIDVLMGNIEILGASLGPSFLNYNSSEENKLYSPRGTALLCIENNRSLFVDCSVKLKNLVVEDLLDEKDVKLRFESDYAIFMCSPLKEPYIKFIERYVSQKIFPEGDAQELRVDFDLQGSWNRSRSSNKWDEILEIISENSKTVICGGKGVGKSTFIRYAVNFLLRRFKKIRVIDLDPGQSEFYYPGCISVVTVEKEVFGPNYTHLLEPDRAILSHINVGYDIKKYHNSVQCLLESTKSMAELPTLVNFPGFTQGIGLDISAQTLKLVEPTLVLQIQSKAPGKNYKVDLTADNVSKTLNEKNFLSQDECVDLSYRFVKFDSLAESNEAWTLEARQGREMNILAYFGKLMTEDISDLTSVDDNLYSINISALSITNLEGKAISPLAINANLVALCSKFNEDSDVFSCHGYGFVRGMDLQTDTLVLLTPETTKTLDNVSHLVLSSVTTPPSLIMTASGLKGHIPYVSVGEPVDFGQFTKRSYLPPRK